MKKTNQLLLINLCLIPTLALPAARALGQALRPARSWIIQNSRFLHTVPVPGAEAPGARSRHIKNATRLACNEECICMPLIQRFIWARMNKEELLQERIELENRLKNKPEDAIAKDQLGWIKMHINIDSVGDQELRNQMAQDWGLSVGIYSYDKPLCRRTKDKVWEKE